MKIVAALAILLSSVELSTAGDSIYDLAKATDDLSTLAVAIEAAGLEETLSDCDAGPFTVFAPQNSAFANFDQDVLADLLKPENQEALQNVILYHAVAGKITAKQILHGNVKQAEKTKKKKNGNITYKGVMAAQGDELKLKVRDHGNKVKANKSTVKAADIMACNGIVHVVNKVLVPP